MIHASFVMLSHVSIIILHHFYAFCWTNLLTRCPVSVSCFLLFLYFRKSTTGNIVGLSSKFTGIFMRRKTPEDRRGTWGATQGPQAGACHGPLGPAGGARPCPLGTASAPSDAYKFPFTLKTTRRPLFSREVIATDEIGRAHV